MWETSDIGHDIFTWMLIWPSYEVRHDTWRDFYPIWSPIRRAAGGVEFVTRTDLTLIDPWPGTSFEFREGEGTCELAWHVQPEVGRGAEFRESCMASNFGLFIDAGAQSVVASDLIFGPLPQSLVIASWSDPESRGRGLEKLIATTGGPWRDAAAVSSGRWERLDRVTYLPAWQVRTSEKGEIQ
ncbi:hypothetical protein [Sphingosinicella rhizophila]|uniref:Uncharacterized protein n=1 Tax=Sphingosinicella rhizophila TaxID=3050082 RepID=A0ABU3QAX1_9SPHN|nr:hypothetical protein [Sphingosinicella sp. GR2756]MDT9600549.1 hypothetical protein [Sphingosinicella sp. GR2756]